jgi:2-amino-4-hydroxy-6-hydroxymethyldihydropteridine diphosphokinase
MAAPSLAFVALGSNLGDSISIVRLAIQRLETLSSPPLLKSSLWRTAPVDCPPGSPPFINAVVGLTPHPDETPESLLDKLQALEKELGRVPKQVPNEPRLLDLDLLVFGNEIRATPCLDLPHPRLHQRRFVLAPLAEIAPDLVVPEQLRTVRELLEESDSDEIVTRVAPPDVRKT